MKTIVIVGRPNVGKSTLFNRLVGKRLALVHDSPGVTRDWRGGEARLGGEGVHVIDTAGLDPVAPLAQERDGKDLKKQSEDLLRRSDVCLFIYDIRQGLSTHEEDLAAWVRKTGVRVVLVANKAEGRLGEGELLAATRLGFGAPVAVSAAHGLGIGDLEDALVPFLKGQGTENPQGEEEERPSREEGEELTDTEAVDRPLRLAIVGRPNVGKSTLINQILGEDRFVTGPEAGLTRDSIGVPWEWEGRPLVVWDTAGIRKKARIEQPLEQLSVGLSLRAIAFSEVVVLMMDALSPLEKQDLILADHIIKEGRALVLAFNKWDCVQSSGEVWKRIQEQVADALPQVRGVEMLRLSGLSGFGVSRLMPAVFKAYGAWNTRLSTGQLNRWLAEAVAHYPPPAPRGRRLKLRYVTQVKGRPPTFVLFCSQENGVPESYLRYLINRLRESFDLWGVPIRFHVRAPKNPYSQRSPRN